MLLEKKKTTEWCCEQQDGPVSPMTTLYMHLYSESQDAQLQWTGILFMGTNKSCCCLPRSQECFCQYQQKQEKKKRTGKLWGLCKPKQ